MCEEKNKKVNTCVEDIITLFLMTFFFLHTNILRYHLFDNILEGSCYLN